MVEGEQVRITCRLSGRRGRRWFRFAAATTATASTWRRWTSTWRRRLVGLLAELAERLAVGVRGHALIPSVQPDTDRGRGRNGVLRCARAPVRALATALLD